MPSFIDRNNTKPGSANTTTRKLIPLSALDVQRDIMDLEFVLRSDLKIEDVKFYLSITEWTEYEMQVFVNFTNPLLISQGL